MPASFDWIKSNVFNAKGKMNPRSTVEGWWRNSGQLYIWQEIHSSTNFLVNPKFNERLFCYLNGITEQPLCNTCSMPVKFDNANKRYNLYCSSKCVGSNPQVQSQKEKTSLQRHGEVKNFSNKNHGADTIISRYGVDNFAKSDLFWAKSLETQLKKYSKLYVQTDDYAAKRKQTSLDKYGVESWMKLPQYKEQVANLNRRVTPAILREISNRYLNGEAKQTIANDLNFSYSHMNKLMMSMGLDTNLPQNKINYHKNFVSSGEKELRDLLPGLVYNDRKLIWPYEIDIVDYDKKIAYEYNGTYWHSDFFKKRSYHLDKLNLLESLGYQLVTIFENVFESKQEILKSKLSSLNSPLVLYHARKATIEEVDYSEASNFISQHHIQGARTSKINLAARSSEGNIIAVATFNQFKDGLELVRFCSSVRSPGILLRFLKHVSGAIYSYANRCYTYRARNIYTISGFSDLGTTAPNYVYVKGKETISRNSAMKHLLPNILKNFDSNLTEYENMVLNGYHRVWDCGNIRYKIEL